MITEAKFIENICKASVGVCFGFIKVTKERRRLRKRVNEFAESAFENKFKHLDLASDIDFEGLSYYLRNSLMIEIENYIAAPSHTVKETLIAKTCNAAHADNRNKKAVVKAFVESVILIMKQDFISNVDKGLMIFAHDLADGLFSSMKNEIDEKTNEILKEIDKLNANDKEIISGITVQENQLRKLSEDVEAMMSVIEQPSIDNTASNVSIHNPFDLLRDFGISVVVDDSVATAVKYSSKNEAMKIRFCVKRKGRIAEFDTTDEYLANLNYTMVEDTVDVVSGMIIQNGKRTEHNYDDNYTSATCYLPWLYFAEMEIYSLGLNKFTDSKFVSSKLTIHPKQIQVSHDIEKGDRSVLWQGVNYKLRRSIENNNRCCYYENEVGNSRIKMNIKFTFETIVIAPQNSPASARVVGSRQGSADDAGQEGPLGGADAGLSQQHRRSGTVLGCDDYIIQDEDSIITNPQPVIDFSVIPVDSCNARSLLESYQALMKIYSTDTLRFVDSKTRELGFSCGVKVNNISEQEIAQHIDMYNKIIDIEEFFNVVFKLEFPIENDLLWHIKMIHDFVKSKRATANYDSLSLTTHMTPCKMEIGNSYGWVSQVEICKQLFDKELPIENVVMVCPNTKYISQDGDTATLKIIGSTVYFWDVEDKIYSNLNKDFNEVLELAGVAFPSPDA